MENHVDNFYIAVHGTLFLAHAVKDNPKNMLLLEELGSETMKQIMSSYISTHVDGQSGSGSLL